MHAILDEAVRAVALIIPSIHAVRADTPLMTTLAQRLRAQTWPAHRQVEATAFVRALLRGSLGRLDYCLLLASLHPIYAALEATLRRHASRPEVAAVYAPALEREAALRADLAALHGDDWPDTLAPQPEALAYAAHLEQLGADAPQLLVAHAYVRYLGDLSGGQAVQRVVTRSLGLAEGMGTRFYDFGSGETVAALAGGLREGLDRIKGDDAALEAIVREAQDAFARHERLFTELEAARAKLSPA
jgi:heme oxygenase (biliverdin-producing, ferredoxin)